MVRTEIKAGTAEWLEARPTMVTASDWPILLLPVNKRPPWMRKKSPLGIWSRIRGLEAPEEDIGDAGKWGLWIEHAAAPWYEDEHPGRYIVRENTLWLADDGPGTGPLGKAWMACTLDGTIGCEKHGPMDKGVWECKGPRDAHAWELPEGGTKTPRYVEIQMQAQLACTARTWGVHSCLTWPRHLVGDVERNQRFIEWAWEKIDTWYTTHVLGDIPPEPEGTEGDARILAALHDPREDVVVMDPQIEELCAKIEVVDADLEAKKARSVALKNALRAWMREKGAERTVDAARTTAWLFSKKAGLRRVKP